MASIRTWLVLAAVISGSGLVVFSTEDFGLMKLWVPEIELNRVATHILDNHLLPSVREYKFEDYILPFGQTTRLSVTDIRITSLESVVSNVQLLSGNRVVISAHLPLLSIAANFTLELLQGNEKPDRYPDAIITALDPSLNITVEIGTGELGSSINLTDCHADFSTLTSNNDDLRQHLLALIELGAKSTLAELVEKVCPFLEKEAEIALVDILDIEETFTIKDAANQNVDIDVRVEYTETSRQSASVVTSVVETGRPAPTFRRSDERFPADGVAGGKFELWMDAPLMELLTQSAITEKVFSDARYAVTLAGQSYDVYASLNAVTYGIEVTEDGVILETHANMTLEHIGQGLNPCITVHVDLDASAPVVITNNDRLIVITPDLNRLKINFTVTRLDGKCEMPNAAQQEKLIDTYSKFFQDSLKGKYIDIDVIKTEYFLFKDIAVKPDKGFVRIIFLLELDVTKAPSERNVTEYHNTAGGKLIALKPLGDAGRVVLEFKALPTPAPPVGDTGRASLDGHLGLTVVLVWIVTAFLWCGIC